MKILFTSHPPSCLGAFVVKQGSGFLTRATVIYPVLPSRENRLHSSRKFQAVQHPGRGLHLNEGTQKWHFQQVRVVGRPIRMEVEWNPNPATQDHFWITISVAGVGPVLLTVNTTSLRNRRAGFDDRVRVGKVRSAFHRPPVGGISRSRLLNYRTIEENANVFYEFYERQEMEDLLREQTEKATWVQAWGVAFAKRILGVHQTHCRRASCAVAEDLVQMDGALRFYRDDEGVAELLLFKFCGQ